MSKVAIGYHSTYGHTELQAEAVFRGAQILPSIEARLYTAGEASARLEELDAADANILGSPTCMGSMSAVEGAAGG
jgi:multimeric flavodoxin WrbA